MKILNLYVKLFMTYTMSQSSFLHTAHTIIFKHISNIPL